MTIIRFSFICLDIHTNHESVDASCFFKYLNKKRLPIDKYTLHIDTWSQLNLHLNNVFIRIKIRGENHLHDYIPNKISENSPSASAESAEQQHGDKAQKDRQ